MEIENEDKDNQPQKNTTLYFGKAYLPKSNKTNSLDNLNIFLENEKQSNLQDNWSKLNKTVKLQKLMSFSDCYACENELTDDLKIEFQRFLKECLDKKKLHRVKDVVYDRLSGSIRSINGLTFYKTTKRFSLKVVEKTLDSTRKQCV